MSKTSRMIVAGAGGIVAAIALTTPAWAYTRQGYQSNYAGVGSDKRWVEVCDMENDGHGVHGEFRLSGGGVMTKGDANGSAGGCGNQTAGSNITEFRVCETGYGCSGWLPVG
ncbi:hypothetical protein [Actinoplanes subglobosus]|uniref:Secreted protein n=1 Tax=Actinoplanes subglobosus TaxID=1547892 RepID=A0ABV8J5B8_9ACTN